MRKKDKKPRHSSKININMPGNIFGNMKPPNLQAISQQKKAVCEVLDCELPKMIGLLADIATCLWRMRDKFKKINIDDLPDEITKANRHLESIWDTLKSAKVEIRGHTNEKYVPGMALKVIAFQPTSSVQTEKIAETIKPSVFYKDILIQVGEVVVATPDTAELKRNGNIKNISEYKERNTE